LKDTYWPIELWIPSHCNKKEYFQRKFLNNKFIKLKIYNSGFIRAPVLGNTYSICEWIIHLLWKVNIFAPPPVNVSVAALYLSYIKGSKLIDILGLNLSFFKSIEIDQHNNELLWINEHFYGKQKRDVIYLNKKDTTLSRMHIEMHKHTSVFYMLNYLSNFFKKNGIKVRNLSKNSYIDCFERN
tara:strand:+ start:503 stop:1054 length:552 start_codon:yes stop_codon:yes gene_type:complete